MEALDALGINAGMLIAYTTNVVLMIALLWALAYKPILDLLEKRREQIGEGLNNARRAEEALASAEADKQALLDKARVEAQQIVAEARKRAEELGAQLKAEAQDDAQKIRDRASADAAGERDVVLADMRDQIVSLSIAAANHLLGRELDEKRARESVNEFFTAIPSGAKGLGSSYTVVTAVPLSEAEKSKFAKELGVSEINYVTDPGILGGVIVRSGATEIDGSYANQLAQMRASLR